MAGFFTEMEVVERAGGGSGQGLLARGGRTKATEDSSCVDDADEGKRTLAYVSHHRCSSKSGVPTDAVLLSVDHDSQAQAVRTGKRTTVASIARSIVQMSTRQRKLRTRDREIYVHSNECTGHKPGERTKRKTYRRRDRERLLVLLLKEELARIRACHARLPANSPPTDVESREANEGDASKHTNDNPRRPTRRAPASAAITTDSLHAVVPTRRARVPAGAVRPVVAAVGRHDAGKAVAVGDGLEIRLHLHVARVVPVDDERRRDRRRVLLAAVRAARADEGVVAEELVPGDVEVLGGGDGDGCRATGQRRAM